MKLLVVSPDYLSHYLPLSAIARAAQRRQISVTIATGRSLRARIGHDGFRWRELRMSAGSNPGLLSDRSALDAAMDDLGSFFAATRRGMIATLRHQALARATDLLWEPELVARSVIELVAQERPDAIVVDHLAFASTLGLRATRRSFTTFVPGHPTQLPLGGEIYGLPVDWPSTVRVGDDEVEGLRVVCDEARRSFTARYNDVLATLATTADPVVDAFAVHGDDVLFNSPAALHPPDRLARLDDSQMRSVFLGGCVRSERPTDEVQSWLDQVGDRPFVYVSLGTFLSARTDVLQRAVDALVELDATVALSTGAADPTDLGSLPAGWLSAPSLPQVALLARAESIVTHGGNNTVTEALSAGCPMVVLPFSTDQFATAADLERTALGVPLDPNRASRAEIARAITATFAGSMQDRARSLSAELRRQPGPELAVDRLTQDVRALAPDRSTREW
ncbi:MAG: nucleotide disphospho-sugar-binding domain-containing protein [Ilumatobacteraceae bacterium]